MSFQGVPRSFPSENFDLAQVLAAKGEHTISVVIPAQNESLTIGAVIDAVRQSPANGEGFIDEVMVVNDHSNDDTPTVAERHGARVIDLDGPSGKGEAMTCGLRASRGSVVVFLDADVTSTTPEYVPRLVAPLLLHDEIELVKAYYERPIHNMPTGGGRVTELAARPVLSLLFPGLGEIRQPLAGETAGRREMFFKVGFESAYGVEIALLIDVARLYGVRAVAQVDLGIRRHRNRPLEELRPMSVEVLRAALERYGVNFPTSN